MVVDVLVEDVVDVEVCVEVDVLVDDVLVTVVEVTVVVASHIEKDDGQSELSRSTAHNLPCHTDGKLPGTTIDGSFAHSKILFPIWRISGSNKD